MGRGRACVPPADVALVGCADRGGNTWCQQTVWAATCERALHLYLNEGVGWCESDLDETPCSFDCDASNSMDDYSVAVMCYEACVAGAMMRAARRALGGLAR